MNPIEWAMFECLRIHHNMQKVAAIRTNQRIEKFIREKYPDIIITRPKKIKNIIVIAKYAISSNECDTVYKIQKLTAY